MIALGSTLLYSPLESFVINPASSLAFNDNNDCKIYIFLYSSADVILFSSHNPNPVIKASIE